MRLLAAILALFTAPAFAAPFAVFPCKANTPAPTECRIKVGTVSSTTPPYTGPTSGKLFCVTDLAGRTGTLALEAVAANAWGAAPAVVGTVNMADVAAPAALDPLQVLPALPQ